MASLIHLDTHVVVWLFAGETARLPDQVREQIEQGPIAISPMVELELQYLFEIGRTSEPATAVVRDLGDRIGLSISTAEFPRVAAEAARLSWTRDPFDRIIVAQAMVDRAKLLTRDETIRTHFADAAWA